MEITGVNESDEIRDLDFGISHEVTWNGRAVKEDGEEKRIDFHEHVAPRMSRPNRTDLELDWEYRRNGDGYIRGKVSAGWDWPQPSSESKGSSRETNDDSEKKDTQPSSKKD